MTRPTWKLRRMEHIDAELGIGEMAEICCVSPKTLRLYHERGLLDPVRVDPESGYRYYTYDQCATVDMILSLQDLGIRLSEIRDIVDGENMDEIIEEMERSSAEIEEHINHLLMRKQAADNFISNARILSDPNSFGKIFSVQVPARHVIVLPLFSEPELPLIESGRDFMVQWERNLRLTKRYMVENGIPISLFHTVGGMIGEDDLLRRELVYKSVYIPLGDNVEIDGFDVRVIPASTYLMVRMSSYYDDEGNNLELSTLNHMLDYIEENGLDICGDFMCGIISDAPLVRFRERGLHFKLNIPVAGDMGSLPPCSIG